MSSDVEASSSRQIVVLAGGLTHERDVPRRSGSGLAESLRRGGHDVMLGDADSDLVPRPQSQNPDAAVIALHGGHDEDVAVQAVLKIVNV